MSTTKTTTTTANKTTKNSKMLDLHLTFISRFSTEVEAINATTKILDNILKDGIKPTEYYNNLFEAGYILPAKNVKGEKQSWPMSKDGKKRLSATNNDTRNAILEVSRLIGAYDGRVNRAKVKAEKLALKALKKELGGDLPDYITKNNVDKITTFVNELENKDNLIEKINNEFSPVVQVIPENDEKPTTTTTTKKRTESAPRVETSEKELIFDPVNLIENLQGFMIALNGNNLELTENEAKQAHKACKTLIELAQKS